jgi:hypothetical protein
MTPLDRLKAMAREWGGEIQRVPPPPDRLSLPRSSDISLCPFDGGMAVDYSRGRVIYWDSQPRLGSLIHEMGHVFAARKPPSEASEWRFFGWEYVVARRAGCAKEWIESNRDYVLGGGAREFGSLTTAQKRQKLASRIRFARRAGLVKHGAPVSIRRRKAA